MTRLTHPPTRTEALRRLSDFAPRAGGDYARLRNHDLPGHPHVSVLSPYLRHRLLTEEEVLAAVLARHSPEAAEKFVQEVLWRTYWKGWLELRPGVWAAYRRGLAAALDRVATESGLRRGWEDACGGRTGIDAFDHWAGELVETGYLHNHARMWFASIWIFTLRLPWELGADFFLRHLLDGDPASNTLSWRWVAGLQTRGKHYLARPDNIARYTGGRFEPRGLETNTAPLDGPPHPDRRPLPAAPDGPLDGPAGLLLTEDDLSPGFVLDRLPGGRAAGTAVMLSHDARSPLLVSDAVGAFTRGAAADALARHGGRLGKMAGVFEETGAVASALGWARDAGLSQVVTPYAPTGPAADRLAELDRALSDHGIALVRIRRAYDSLAWPAATAGFFKFRERIPAFLSTLGLAPAD